MLAVIRSPEPAIVLVWLGACVRGTDVASPAATDQYATVPVNIRVMTNPCKNLPAAASESCGSPACAFLQPLI